MKPLYEIMRDNDERNHREKQQKQKQNQKEADIVRLRELQFTKMQEEKHPTFELKGRKK